MPVMKPGSTAGKTPPAVKIENPDARTVVVDSEIHPPTTLLTSIEGSSWIVDYFSQVLGADNQLSEQGTTKPGVYQQYTLTKGLELKVTTPLSASQDPEQKTMMVTGTSNMYPLIIPNEGDMFVADVGDGRAGVFTVTTTERKSLFKETTYVINYTLVDYATEARLADLFSKVVKKVNFVKDFSKYGQNPFVTDSELVDLGSLQEWYRSLVDMYFTMFSSNEYRTILVPGQEYPTYDHFLMKALTRTISASENYKIRSNNVLNCDGDPVMQTTTVWDMLIKRDARMLRYSWSKAGTISARLFSSNPAMHGIRYSGIGNVIYPINPFVSVDHNYRKFVVPLTYSSADSSVAKELEDVEETVVDAFKSLSASFDIFDALAAGEDISKYNQTILPIQDDVDDVPSLNGTSKLVNPILADDYYLFSEAFYTGDTTKVTALEALVLNYLGKKEINTSKLVELCEESNSWGAMEKFYYIPVLLILIKARIRSN